MNGASEVARAFIGTAEHTTSNAGNNIAARRRHPRRLTSAGLIRNRVAALDLAEFTSHRRKTHAARECFIPHGNALRVKINRRATYVPGTLSGKLFQVFRNGPRYDLFENVAPKSSNFELQPVQIKKTSQIAAGRKT
jgi:hypothetical protein